MRPRCVARAYSTASNSRQRHHFNAAKGRNAKRPGSTRHDGAWTRAVADVGESVAASHRQRDQRRRGLLCVAISTSIPKPVTIHIHVDGSGITFVSMAVASRKLTVENPRAGWRDAERMRNHPARSHIVTAARLRSRHGRGRDVTTLRGSTTLARRRTPRDRDTVAILLPCPHSTTAPPGDAASRPVRLRMP